MYFTSYKGLVKSLPFSSFYLKCSTVGPSTKGSVITSSNICVSLQSVEGVLGTNNYQHNKVNQWTSAVVEQCLNQLTKLAKPFKYIGMFSTNVIIIL